MKLEIIKEQIQDVDHWTTDLIETFDERNWNIMDALETSMNWQVGHIIISKYYHAMHSVLLADNEYIRRISTKIPLKDFFKYYAHGSDPKAVWFDRPDKSQLLKFKKEVDLTTSLALERLSEADLEKETTVKNPIAKTRYQALTFSYKHQMWHNGQMAMMKRMASDAL